MWLFWFASCVSENPPAAPVAVGALVFDAAPPKNVWMLSIDTLRRDHVDVHATDEMPNSRVRMPFLSARLREGVVMADHEQCSNWTLHAMTCTLVGRPVEDLGWMPKPRDGTAVPDGQATLAVRLAEAGYNPLAASSNVFFGAEWNGLQGYGPDLAGGTDALSVGCDGLRGLRAEVASNPGAPWFLHVHVKEPHDPYDPPAAYLEGLDLPPLPYDLGTAAGLESLTEAYPSLDPATQAVARMHLEAHYAADLRWLDDKLAALWVEMAAEGWLDDTLVVVWTDHGEGLYEHGTRDHARQLYGEETDAVLAFWADGLRPATVSTPTHAIDLLPTMLAVLGLEAGEPPLPGAVVGTALPDRPRFTSTWGYRGPAATVTVAGQKLMVDFNGVFHRYDRVADPAEEDDLFTTEDDVSEALWPLLAPRLAALGELVGEPPPRPP